MPHCMQSPEAMHKVGLVQFCGTIALSQTPNRPFLPGFRPGVNALVIGGDNPETFSPVKHF